MNLPNTDIEHMPLSEIRKEIEELQQHFNVGNCTPSQGRRLAELKAALASVKRAGRM